MEGEVSFSFALPSLLPHSLLDRNITSPYNISIRLLIRGFFHVYLASSFCRWYYNNYTSPIRLTVACSTIRSSVKHTFWSSGACLKSIPRAFSYPPPPQTSIIVHTHLRSMKPQRRNGTPRARTRAPGAQIYGDGHSRARPSPPQKFGLGVRAFDDDHHRRRRSRRGGSSSGS